MSHQAVTQANSHQAVTHGRAENPVVPRVAALTLRQCHELDQLAYVKGAVRIQPELESAVQAALQRARPEVVQRLAAQTCRALRESQCHDLHRPGALTCAWAAALACSVWGQVGPDVIEELCWRWQRVTGQRIHDLLANCQQSFGVTRTWKLQQAQAMAALCEVAP